MAKFQDMCFRKIDIGIIEENLGPDTLKLLRLFDGVTPNIVIRQKSGLESSVFKNSFMELFKKQLIEEVRSPDIEQVSSIDFVDTSEIEKVRDAVVEIVGPIGQLLLDDTLEKMKLNIDQVPENRLAELISMISEEIPGEKKQKCFLELVC